MARRKILWLALGVFLACSITGKFILYQKHSLTRDIHYAELLYRGFRPNYNLHVQHISDFGPDEEVAYPVTGQFPSSTEFFINLITKQILTGFNYGIFAVSGVPAYWGNDQQCFSRTNNAWCVTLDLDPMRLPDVPDWRRKSSEYGKNGESSPPLLAPFIFSRNLDIRSLSEAHSDRLRDVPPYGREGVLVVMTDGEAKFLRPEQIESEFNPMGLTNAVLRP